MSSVRNVFRGLRADWRQFNRPMPARLALIWLVVLGLAAGVTGLGQFEFPIPGGLPEGYGDAHFIWYQSPPASTAPIDYAVQLYQAIWLDHPAEVRNLLRSHPELVDHPIHCGFAIDYVQGGQQDCDEPLTPLQMTVDFREAALVKAVCDCKPNLEVRDSEGRTPLFVALALLHDVMIGRVLADHGANLNATDKAGDSIWTRSFTGDDSEADHQLPVIQFLLDRGVDPSAQPQSPEQLLAWRQVHHLFDVRESGSVGQLDPAQAAQVAILYRYIWHWPSWMLLAAVFAAMGFVARRTRNEWQARGSWSAAGAERFNARCAASPAGEALATDLTDADRAGYMRAFGEVNRMRGVAGLLWLGVGGAIALALVDPLYRLDASMKGLVGAAALGIFSLLFMLSEHSVQTLVFLALQALAALVALVFGAWLAVLPWMVAGPAALSMAGGLAAAAALLRLWWLWRQYVSVWRRRRLDRRIARKARQLYTDGERTDIDSPAGHWDEAGL
ncbi:MAG: hypothetical protein ACREJ2_04175 [Planctomycetota bacterium]